MKLYIIILFFFISNSCVYSQNVDSLNMDKIICFLISENELDTMSPTPLSYFSSEIIFRTEISTNNVEIGVYRLASQASHAWTYVILKNNNKLDFLHLYKEFDKDFSKVVRFVKKHELYTEEELLKCLETIAKIYTENLLSTDFFQGY